MDKNIYDSSQLSIAEQEKIARDFIVQIKKIEPKRLSKGDLAITTDTHGDFVSMAASFFESEAVLLDENELVYYDLNAGRERSKKEIEELERIKIEELKKINIETNREIEILSNQFNELQTKCWEYSTELDNWVKDYSEEYYKLKNLDRSESKRLCELENKIDEKKMTLIKIKPSFAVFPRPIPNPNFMGEIYHLGDIGDRGKENVISFLFLKELCLEYQKIRKEIPVKLVIGNHESSDNDSGLYKNGADSYGDYESILVEMISKKLIRSGYVIGTGKEAILLSHSAFVEEDLSKILCFLRDLTTQRDDKYKETRVEILECITREFRNQEENSLFDKLMSSVRGVEQVLMKKKFSPIELVRIRILISEAILKKDIDENHKLKEGGEVNDGPCYVGLFLSSIDGIVLFWNRYFSFIISPTEEKSPLILNQGIGHDNGRDIRECFGLKLKKDNNNKMIVGFDMLRSFGYSDDKMMDFLKETIYPELNNCNRGSFAVTTYYSKDENGNLDLAKIRDCSSYFFNRTEQGLIDIEMKPFALLPILSKDIIFDESNKLPLSKNVKAVKNEKKEEKEKEKEDVEEYQGLQCKKSPVCCNIAPLDSSIILNNSQEEHKVSFEEKEKQRKEEKVLNPDKIIY